MQNDQRVAFDLFYAEHAMPAYRFALRLSGDRDDAEDLVAEALAKAYRNWSQYRGEAHARTWLFAIVRNEWRMLCRRRPLLEERLGAVELIAGTLEHENFELAQAICALPEALKEAFLLVKGEGLTHSEAARVVRVPVGTMYFRVHSAVQKLKTLLVDESDPEPKEKVICPREM
jgi:RNA polymerase sigma-70 factor (ECF subfamily)